MPDDPCAFLFREPPGSLLSLDDDRDDEEEWDEEEDWEDEDEWEELEEDWEELEDDEEVGRRPPDDW